jgi:hypothetical protein
MSSLLRKPDGSRAENSEVELLGLGALLQILGYYYASTEEVEPFVYDNKGLKITF